MTMTNDHSDQPAHETSRKRKHATHYDKGPLDHVIHDENSTTIMTTRTRSFKPSLLGTQISSAGPVDKSKS